MVTGGMSWARSEGRLRATLEQENAQFEAFLDAVALPALNEIADGVP